MTKRSKPLPPTSAEQAKRTRQRKTEKTATALLQNDPEVVRALEESGHLISAPRNEDLYAEHKRNREIAMAVHDIALSAKRVSVAVDQDGNGGAFILPHNSKSLGLVRQLVTMIGSLFGRPVDTNHIDKVQTGGEPGGFQDENTGVPVRQKRQVSTVVKASRRVSKA
jgi:hypothetical protein